MDTLLYFVAGGALCVAALVVAAIGLRDREFPTPGAFRVGAVLLTLLVVVTMVGAVLNARAEQSERREHKAAQQEAAAQHETP